MTGPVTNVSNERNPPDPERISTDEGPSSSGAASSLMRMGTQPLQNCE